MSASDPGQNMVAVFTPCRSAETQIGSPLIPPAAIGDGLLVAEREAAQFGVDHVVADDAVVIGMQARDQGVVIGEGHAGEGRLHRPRCALGRQLRQHRRRPALQIVGAETVNGDQDDVRRLNRLDRRRGRRGGAGGDGQRQDGDARQPEQTIKHERLPT
jgi:hypothetical protein